MVRGEANNLVNVITNAMSWTGNAAQGYKAVVDQSGGDFSDLIELMYDVSTLGQHDHRWPIIFQHLVDNAENKIVEGGVLRTVLLHWRDPRKLTTKPQELRYFGEVQYVMERESIPGHTYISCYSYTLRNIGGIEVPVLTAPALYSYSTHELETMFPDFQNRWQTAVSLEIDTMEPAGALFVLGLMPMPTLVCAELPTDMAVGSEF